MLKVLHATGGDPFECTGRGGVRIPSAFPLGAGYGCGARNDGVKSWGGAWQVERLRAELETVAARKKKRKSDKLAGAEAKKRHL